MGEVALHRARRHPQPVGHTPDPEPPADVEPDEGLPIERRPSGGNPVAVQVAGDGIRRDLEQEAQLLERQAVVDVEPFQLPLRQDNGRLGPRRRSTPARARWRHTSRWWMPSSAATTGIDRPDSYNRTASPATTGDFGWRRTPARARRVRTCVSVNPRRSATSPAGSPSST